MQPWYPFYWSDYSGKTFDLSQGQHGAYILLLRWIYTNGKPIPEQQCYSIARASTEQERQNVDFVLASFFVKQDGVFENEKANEVIAEAEEKHERRVNAGRQRKTVSSPETVRLPSTQEQCSSNAQAIPPTTTITTTTRIEDRSPKPPRPKTEVVETPHWLPEAAWREWLAYRKTRRLSSASVTLHKQIAQLDRYREEGHDPTEVIDLAIARGWQGLYPPKGETNGSRNSNRRPSAHENLLAGFGITDPGEP